VQMFAQIEQMFQVKLPVAMLFEAPTLAELSQILSREALKSRWYSLVTIQPKGSRPPFFCMHGAGGNVLIYRELRIIWERTSLFTDCKARDWTVIRNP